MFEREHPLEVEPQQHKEWAPTRGSPWAPGVTFHLALVPDPMGDRKEEE